MIVNALSQICQTILSEDLSENWCIEQEEVGVATTLLEITGLALIAFSFIRHTFNNLSSAPTNQKQDPLAYIRNPELLKTLPTAMNGKTTVYLGDRFVIKDCEEHEGLEFIAAKIDRIAAKSKAHIMIKAQRLNHLVVPRIFNLEENDRYLVEERLPIHQSINKAQKLYEENKELFTDAVKEFTQLLMRGQFTDLQQRSVGPLLLETPMPRYDNVCPYIENGKGMLGLVDLEHFEQYVYWWSYNKEDYGKEIKYCNSATAETLIHLFPFHIEEILSVMKSEGLQLEAEERNKLYELKESQIEQRHSKHFRIKG